MSMSFSVRFKGVKKLLGPVFLLVMAVGVFEDVRSLGGLVGTIPAWLWGPLFFLLGAGFTLWANWGWFAGQIGLDRRVVEVKTHHRNGEALLSVKNLKPTDQFAAQVVAWGREPSGPDSHTPLYLRWDDVEGPKREISRHETAFLRIASLESRARNTVLDVDPVSKEHAHVLNYRLDVIGPREVRGSRAYGPVKELGPIIMYLRVKIIPSDYPRTQTEALTLRVIGRPEDDPRQRLAFMQNPVLMVDREDDLPPPTDASCV